MGRWMVCRTVEYLENGQRDHTTISQFQRARGRPPDIIVRYDEGDVMAYEVNDNWVTDGDHHTLPIYMVDISSVGSGAYAIWWNGEQDPEEGTAPPGWE